MGVTDSIEFVRAKNETEHGTSEELKTTDFRKSRLGGGGGGGGVEDKKNKMEGWSGPDKMGGKVKTFVAFRSGGLHPAVGGQSACSSSCEGRKSLHYEQIKIRGEWRGEAGLA